MTFSVRTTSKRCAYSFTEPTMILHVQQWNVLLLDELMVASEELLRLASLAPWGILATSWRLSFAHSPFSPPRNASAATLTTDIPSTMHP